MNAISIEESYNLLNVSNHSSDDDIIRSYRLLAMRYHPDKNRDKIEWATKIMSRINSAYTIIMAERFKAKEEPEKKHREAPEQKRTNQRKEYEDIIKKRQEEVERQKEEELKTEKVIDRFAAMRETVKESLYRFFQYSLYNIARREQGTNRGIFNDIVSVLRRNYHLADELAKATTDKEVIEHIEVFKNMIFNFYRASECLNVPDRYDNGLDIEAFRLYRRGEESLHKSHREVFFSRHNRGSFDKDNALAFAYEAKTYFEHTLSHFPESSWVTETGIKLEYTNSLIAYIMLFFSEE